LYRFSCCLIAVLSAYSRAPAALITPLSLHDALPISPRSRDWAHTEEDETGKEAGVPELQTDVAIVGAGPAGLMLAHLLHNAGIDSVVIDNRSRDDIAHTHRAGILEAGSVRMLEAAGVESRVHTAGHRHDGINIRVDGTSHPFDFPELVGESVWLYPQNEIFVDLAAARER